MSTIGFQIAHLLVVFLGWVFLLSALALIGERFIHRMKGPLFKGWTFAGYGITWFSTRGNEVVHRALVRDGVRLFHLGGLAWFWQAPQPEGRAVLWRSPQ